MKAKDFKLGKPINVWQSLPDRITGQGAIVRQNWDKPAEMVREKHDELCDYIDDNLPDNEALQDVVLGQIPDGTISIEKMNADFFRDIVIKYIANRPPEPSDNADEGHYIGDTWMVPYIKLHNLVPTPFDINAGDFAVQNANKSATGSVFTLACLGGFDYARMSMPFTPVAGHEYIVYCEVTLTTAQEVTSITLNGVESIESPVIGETYPLCIVTDSPEELTIVVNADSPAQLNGAIVDVDKFTIVDMDGDMNGVNYDRESAIGYLSERSVFEELENEYAGFKWYCVSAEGDAKWNNTLDEEQIRAIAIKIASETVIVNVSTEDSKSVTGQKVTLHDVTIPEESKTYTLGDNETSAVFYVPIGHNYYVSVDSKDGYAKPDNSLTKKVEIAGTTSIVNLEYEKVKRYGFRRERGERDPDARITYLHDAVGLSPAFTALASGLFDEGDWGGFIEEVCRPVMLKTNGIVDYVLSRNDFTKKADGVTASDVANTSYDGNAMIAFRKYKWVLRDSDATYDYVIFSNDMYNGMYKPYAHQNALGNIMEEFYWGAFKGTNVSSKLRSLGVGSVMVSQTRNTEVSYATNIGAGYYTIYKSGWDFISDLLTLISKSDNSQAKFGKGRCKTNNSSAIACGTLKDKPMFWGNNDETSDVKVFGIEGYWGNVWEGMAGLINANGNIKVKMTPPYNFDGDGYHATGITPAGTSGGYVNIAQAYTEYGYVPQTASGADDKEYCDGLWFNNAQNDYALVGGFWNRGLHGGCRCVDLHDFASATGASVGSRLSFLSPA